MKQSIGAFRMLLLVVAVVAGAISFQVFSMIPDFETQLFIMLIACLGLILIKLIINFLFGIRSLPKLKDLSSNSGEVF